MLTWSARRRVRRAAPIAIRRAVMGTEAKFEGRVNAPERMLAPLSRRPCVLYRVVVWLSDHDGRGPDLVVDETDAVEFDLVDATGAVHVDPLPCHFDAHAWWDWPRWRKPIPDTFAEFAAHHEEALVELRAPRWRRPTLRVAEAVVLDGATVRVFGKVTGRPSCADSGPYRGDAKPSVGIWDGGRRFCASTRAELGTTLAPPRVARPSRRPGIAGGVARS